MNTQLLFVSTSAKDAMEMGSERFSPGQIVNWGELNDAMRIAVRSRGLGPFKVVSVEHVPDNCNCGAPMVDADNLYPHICPYAGIMGYGRPIRESVGHTQWVSIEDAYGRILMQGSEIARFSGKYFTAA